ncbi:MAG: BMFP domain-containing protein YqiC, partial [Cocleimonas sp.]
LLRTREKLEALEKIVSTLEDKLTKNTEKLENK